MKCLFYVPNDLEGLLPAISTIQAFVLEQQKMLSREHRENTIGVDVVCATEALQPFMGALDCRTLSVAQPKRGEYDFVFVFDPELAYQISLPTQRHITNVFGLQVGVEPPTLPDLSRVAEWVKAAFPRLFESVIVERRSGLTYLACAMGRPVVEIYPADRHRRWLSKWGHKYYAMVYGTEDAVTIERAVEAMLCRVGHTTSPECKTLMVPPQSTVASAAEPSLSDITR